jgi:hypothetical protein
MDFQSPEPQSGIGFSLTLGNYATEQESAAAFDDAIERSGLFRVYREVPGETLHPLPGMDKNGFRIDRILFPTEKIRGAGWSKGLAGVELKRSGEKLGHPISQSLDYLRAAWFLPSGIKVLVDYVFIFPLDTIAGPLGSVMAQNRIGGVCLCGPPESDWYQLKFSLSEQIIIRHFLNRNETKVKFLNIGERTGSR